MGSFMASNWRELSGSKNWKGLLQPPLDPDLRSYIIHYAQMVGAITGLFNGVTKEPNASKQEFFSKACLVKGNPYKYDVTHFLYASSSWFGYVAVATDEGKLALGRRDILVAWRGTKLTKEMIRNFRFCKRSASYLFPIAKGKGTAVHAGFLSFYTGIKSSSRIKTSARQQVLDAVRELVDRYQNEDISITVIGYSLGGALATLTAMDIVANGYNKPTDFSDKSCMVTAFTFGSPRIGNAKLGSVFKLLSKHLHLLRIVNKYDLVPTLPPGDSSYAHFGKKLNINTSVSIYLGREKPFGKHTRGAILPLEEDESESSRQDTFSLDEEKTERQLKRRRSIDPYDEPKPKRRRSSTSSFHESESKWKDVIIETLSSGSHDMNMYAHGVAIKDMKEIIPFYKLYHDIALLNKHSEHVKKEYGIPKDWWASKNRKKMFQLENGRWMVV